MTHKEKTNRLRAILFALSCLQAFPLFAASHQLPRSQPEEPSLVTLSPDQLKNRTIKVIVAQSSARPFTLSAPATLEFEPDGVMQLGPLLPAKVVSLRKHLGDSVKAGDVVAVLDSVALGKLKARLLTARARLEVMQQKYQRQKQLVARKVSTNAQLDQARADFVEARSTKDSIVEQLKLYGLTAAQIAAVHGGGDRAFSRFALSASQGGTIEKMAMTPGQTLAADATPIEVVNSARMRLLIQADEKNSARIHKGEAIQFRPDALPEQSFKGSVESVGLALSPQAHTLVVRALVMNPDGLLRAGMYGTARITLPGKGHRAIVPVAAIQTVNGHQIVFQPLKGHPGQFKVTPVQPGQEKQGQAGILKGLRPGDKVVSEGSFALMSILTAGSRQDTD